MCGVVALWHEGPADVERLTEIARAMRDTLVQRGPDGAGVSVDRDAGVVLGQRRLAILDLSPHGHQPMQSASGRYEISFNGEVYNHLELRRDLRAVAWRGTSDTETMLAAIEAWGLEVAVRRFVGMFAFALWDRRERTMFLVRDRVGIKPLVWGTTDDGTLVVGSDLRALRAHPRFDTTIDRAALAAYFETSCVPAPLTIHAAARKVRPGTFLVFRSATAAPEEKVYWSAHEVAARGEAERLSGTDAELLERVEAALRESVRLRMLSDVPLGAFLSGGVDSSLVVALAQECSAEPVRTFSIGSADAAYDESAFASAVATRLGTRHTALTLTGQDALDLVPRMASAYDEPFADSSQIPTFLVSRLARTAVTVALSGDGGDEVFGGYNRYLWAPRIERVLGLPRVLRRLASSAIRAVPREAWDRASARARRGRLVGDKAHKAARALEAGSLAEMHAVLRRQWPTSPLLDAPRARDPSVAATLSGASQLMLRDLVEYLPDDILTKVDRASMDVSLEARVPLLDHRVIELAWRLPSRMKIRGGRGKWALRELLARRVPREIFERPKTGFSVPVSVWLRGPLRGWAEDLLRPSELRGAGLDAELVRGRWLEHVGGRADHGLALWDVLAFRAWEATLSSSREARPLGAEAVAP